MSEELTTPNLTEELINNLKDAVDLIRQLEATRQPVEPIIAEGLIQSLNLCAQGVLLQRQDITQISIANLHLIGRVDFLEIANIKRGGEVH